MLVSVGEDIGGKGRVVSFLGDARQVGERGYYLRSDEEVLMQNEFNCHVDSQQRERKMCRIIPPSFKASFACLHEQPGYRRYRDEILECKRPGCRQTSGSCTRNCGGTSRRKSINDTLPATHHTKFTLRRFFSFAYIEHDRVPVNGPTDESRHEKTAVLAPCWVHTSRAPQSQHGTSSSFHVQPLLSI